MLALLAVGCQSSPESGCRTEPGESGVSIDCDGTDGAWSRSAETEALEGFEGRAPGSRP